MLIKRRHHERPKVIRIAPRTQFELEVRPAEQRHTGEEFIHLMARLIREGEEIRAAQGASCPQRATPVEFSVEAHEEGRGHEIRQHRA